MSEKEIAMIVLAVIGLVLIILFRKEIAKIVITLICLAGILICINILAPDKVKMAGEYIQSVSKVTKLAENSENIRIKKEKDGKLKSSGVQIKVNKKWYSIDDINRIEENAKTGNLSITIKDKRYKLEDKTIKEMLKYMKKIE